MQQDNLMAGLALALDAIDAYPRVWAVVVRDSKQFIAISMRGKDSAAREKVLQQVALAFRSIDDKKFRQFRGEIDYFESYMRQLGGRYTMPAMKNAADLLLALHELIVKPASAISLDHDDIPDYMATANFSSYLEAYGRAMAEHASGQNNMQLHELVQKRVTQTMINSLDEYILQPLRPQSTGRDGMQSRYDA